MNVITQKNWKNWWVNQVCAPEKYYKPNNLEEIIEIIRSANAQEKKVKVVGSGHSWSKIVCTDEYMISLERLNKVLAIDKKEKTITAQSGIYVYQLNDFLFKNGLALSSLGTVSDQTIAGAIATGTHGSSLYHGGIAESILELELIDGMGNIIQCSKTENADIFAAACINLGSLGIITQIKLQCEDFFFLAEKLEIQPIENVLENLEFLSQQEYFRFWYETQKQTAILSTFLRQPISSNNHFIYFIRYVFNQLYWLFWNGIVNFGLSYKIKPLTIVGRSYHIFNYPKLLLKTAKVLFNLTNGYHNKRIFLPEYGIGVEKVSIACKKIINAVHQGKIKGNLKIEVRFGAAEETWLSTAYHRPSCYIQIEYWKGRFKSEEDYTRAIVEIDNMMKDFDARPHWAKDNIYTQDDWKKVYPCWEDFCQLRQKLDPNQCFSNEYLDKLFNQEHDIN